MPTSSMDRNNYLHYALEFTVAVPPRNVPHASNNELAVGTLLIVLAELTTPTPSCFPLRVLGSYHWLLVPSLHAEQI